MEEWSVCVCAGDRQRFYKLSFALSRNIESRFKAQRVWRISCGHPELLQFALRPDRRITEQKL